VLPPDLARALDGLRTLGIRGANLTLPHKELAMGLVDTVDPLAARVGAINTVVNDRGRLNGYNTDVAGFSAALRSVHSDGPRGWRCLVLGAGGAARAVVAALVDEGATRIWLWNRTHERAVGLCRSVSEWGDTPCDALTLNEAAELAPSVDLIVNATSAGLTESVKELPLDVDTLHSGHVLVDLVYGSAATPLVSAALARGARAIDGTEMLVMQAASSYRLWTGEEPPVDVMRAIVKRCER
jgi:shikimate dehydrogenase